MAANALNNKMELFSAFIQKEIRENSPLMPFLTDHSALALPGVNVITISKMSSFTVQDRAFGAATTENAPLTDSGDQIPINKNKIILWGYDAADDIQSNINYQLQAAQRAATAHVRDMNTQIITLWNTVAGLSVNGAVPANITADAILTMRQQLLANYSTLNGAVLVIGADQEKQMLLLPEFSRYDYRGGGVAPVYTGMIGQVYGIPVVINQSVGAQQAYMVDPLGAGIAIQKTAKYAEDVALKYGTEGKEAAVDMLYGLGGLLLGEGTIVGVGATPADKTPYIAKLQD